MTISRPTRAKRLLAVGLGVAGAAAIALGAFGVLSSRPAEADLGPPQLLPEKIPITQFPIKPVRDAKELLKPSELVLGVTVGEESRAYALNMLTSRAIHREILNDTLGGQAIAATW